MNEREDSPRLNPLDFVLPSSLSGVGVGTTFVGFGVIFSSGQINGLSCITRIPSYGELELNFS